MPGKVISVHGRIAVVDFAGNRMNAEAGLVAVKQGDSVLVHAGCILQVLPEDEANILADLFAELEDL